MGASARSSLDLILAIRLEVQPGRRGRAEVKLSLAVGQARYVYLHFCRPLARPTQTGAEMINFRFLSIHSIRDWSKLNSGRFVFIASLPAR